MPLRRRSEANSGLVSGTDLRASPFRIVRSFIVITILMHTFSFFCLSLSLVTCLVAPTFYPAVSTALCCLRACPCSCPSISIFLQRVPQRASSPNRFHAKEPLSEGGRYRMTLDADQKLYHMAKLEITQVVTGDRGEYRALARNKHGEGVATINLNFEGSGKPK